MYLTRHETAGGARWAADGAWLPPQVTLDLLLQSPASALGDLLATLPRGGPAHGALLAPVEASSEVWAAGVTYMRSREAREAESTVKDVYARVYEAPRPELFFKAVGWRVVGHEMPIRIRADSRWNVPEPELTLVVNAQREIVGYTVGDDVSSRDIEGENPLYLPQAKVYDGACAIGPGIRLARADRMRALDVSVAVGREGRVEFEGRTSTANMARSLESLVEYLGRELTFPRGAFLMTGTGIVPPEAFSLRAGDRVTITIGALTLENEVQAAAKEK